MSAVQKLEMPTNRSAVETCEDLLETIKSFRSAVGDALEDEEFSFYMLGKNPPAQDGFSFLCFHNGFVTLNVPPQDDAAWHPANAWISPEKEKLARKFAEDHSLLLSEPPDSTLRFLLPAGKKVHHHLHFCNRKETIVIAQPEFLKIRLYASGTRMVLPPVPGMLKELSALYQ